MGGRYLSGSSQTFAVLSYGSFRVRLFDLVLCCEFQSAQTSFTRKECGLALVRRSFFAALSPLQIAPSPFPEQIYEVLQFFAHEAIPARIG